MSWSPSSPAIGLLAMFVEERTGLHYGPEDRELFADKVSYRAMEAGFESSLDYYYFLRYDDANGAEMTALTDVLVVNETYFFRELAPLEAVVEEILTPLVSAGRRARVWSAACSTGEEPYSLAMMLAARGVLGSVEIVASDISTRVLDRARKSQHSARSIRAAPPPRYAPYLLTENGTPTVAPIIRRSIDFRQINLLDAKSVASLGEFDLILCRNALIYFRDEVVGDVIQGITSRLVPGGTLLVGISESLLRIPTTLLCEERRGVFLYRKPS